MSPRSLRPHPARDAILDAMRRHGGPISPLQLSRITGATLGSTAYHVRALLAAAAIEPAGEERGIRGSTEHFYKLVDEDTQNVGDAARQLLGLCGVLTVHHADGGGYPVPTELDGEAVAEFEMILTELRLQVQVRCRSAAPQKRRIAALSGELRSRCRPRIPVDAWRFQTIQALAAFQCLAGEAKPARSALA